jgi:hypothetical protein
VGVDLMTTTIRASHQLVTPEHARSESWADRYSSRYPKQYMNMASEADKILKTAEKKANSSGGWFSSASSKWEDAGDLFAQAANAYKVERNWRASGIAFEK